MTERELALHQSAILHRCAAKSEPHVSDRRIAVVAGVDPSEVSHWRYGRREIRLPQLVRLVEAFGAEVLVDVVELGGARLTHLVPSDPVPFQEGARRIAVLGSEYVNAVLSALGDGRINREELASIRNARQNLQRVLEELETTPWRVGGGGS